MSTDDRPPGSLPEQHEAQRERLGERLISAGKLEAPSLERALRLQQEQSAREVLGIILVKLGLVSEQDVARCVSEQIGVPLVDKDDFAEPADGESSVSMKFLKESKVILLSEDDRQVRVAMADPGDAYLLNALGMATGKQVVPYIGVASEIELALERLAESRKSPDGSGDLADGFNEANFQDDVEHLKEMASEAPVIKTVSQLINRAVESAASDIHIEPFENRLAVRYRIDGMLHDIELPSGHSAAAVISRIKIMANLNIAERRLPQDGRFKTRARGRDIDLRVSTVPTLFGESVVMRILHRDDINLDFSDLGFETELKTEILALLDRPHGILLVTGPTGSGKTTTLYTALRHLNRPERKILTVEDPVEYNLEGVNQIQVKPQIDLTFANALRAIVRQDPDVVMIGEMRDRETAAIAVQSALTGHLVLSTIHTNNAAGSVTRLMDMGIEDYLLTSSVVGILAQRLVRKLCPACRESHTPLPEVVRRWRLDEYSGNAEPVLYRARGCARCGGSGYAGRVAILELLTMSEPLRQGILEHADAGILTRLAVAEGMRPMMEDGMRKVVAGVTTLEEVLRVTQEQ